MGYWNQYYYFCSYVLLYLFSYYYFIILKAYTLQLPMLHHTKQVCL